VKHKKLFRILLKRKWLLLLVVLFLIAIVPKGIVFHHSAVPFSNDESQNDVKLLDTIHRSRGFSIFCNGKFYYVGYHYIILPDGTLQQGRPERCQGAHTLGYNDYIGICLIGDFSPADNAIGDKGPKQPTNQQLITLVSLTRRLKAKYNLSPTSIYTHHDLNSETECPGENFQAEYILEQIGN
jgi:hypothetical protein